MNDFDIESHRHAITDLVTTASRGALAWYRQPMTVENKVEAGFDPVTAADRAVEDEIRAGLRALFPDHAVYGEERGATGDGPVRWIIDPIDGTRAFISGQPMWGTLLGLEVDGRPIAGWMHQPVLDETHVATPAAATLIRHGAATELVAASVTDLDEAIVMCTHPDMFDTPPLAAAFARLESRVRLVRYSGDCVNYGLLAAGQVHLVVENKLAPYDIVPLLPIIEGSGAVVTDREGKPPLDGGFVVAACTAELHGAALDVLGSA